MKIKYTFANGEISEVEVTEEMGTEILNLDRLEYNNNHKETRRHTTLNNGFSDSKWLAVEDENIKSLSKDDSNIETLQKAVSNLQPQQKDLLYKLLVKGYSQKEVALKNNVSCQAINNKYKRIINKLRSFFAER